MIASQEFHVVNDQFVIRTRCPWDKVTEDMVLLRAGNSNLLAGDHVLVQCYDHEYKTLIAEATFVVAARKEQFVSAQVSDRDIRQGTRTSFIVVRRTDWWFPFEKKEEKQAESEDKNDNDKLGAGQPKAKKSA